MVSVLFLFFAASLLKSLTGCGGDSGGAACFRVSFLDSLTVTVAVLWRGGIRAGLWGRPGRTLRTALSAAGLWHLWWLPDAQPCPGRLSLRAEEQMDGGEEEGLGLAPLLSAPEGDSGGDCS